MVGIDFGLEYWKWEGVIKWDNKRKGKRKEGEEGDYSSFDVGWLGY